MVIKFFTEVNPATTQQLMQLLDTCHREGVKRITLLISTTGGSVHHGVSLYNYLRGLTDVELSTHNFGAVDSIGIAIYAAGSRRLSVPQARFLVHRVTNNFVASAPGQVIQLGEAALSQTLKSLLADEKNIASIVAENSNRTASQVLAAMKAQQTLLPEQMRRWGLVHAIEHVTIPAGVSLLTVQ